MTDAEIIQNLGGPTALAKKLGISVQRVHNWKVRGIPAGVRLKFPRLLRASAKQKQPAEA